MAATGWIKIYRKIMDDPLYFEERFTRMQAWLDLLLLANFEDSEIHIRGNRVVIRRGQIAKSKEWLANRWGWNKRTVMKFLDALQNRGQITLQNSNLIGLISIVNYDEYQNSAPQNAPQNAPPYKNIKNNISLSYTREEFLLNLDECYERLRNNTIWAETITMNTHAEYPQFGNEQFSIYLRKFFAKLANEGVTEKSPKDAMAHFANWLKKELSNEKNRTSHISKQEANAYAMQQFVNYCSTPDNSWTPGPDKPF